jgi:hypothetical protein
MTTDWVANYSTPLTIEPRQNVIGKFGGREYVIQDASLLYERRFLVRRRRRGKMAKRGSYFAKKANRTTNNLSSFR